MRSTTITTTSGQKTISPPGFVGVLLMLLLLPTMHRDMSTETLARDARLIFISELSTPPCCHNFHMYRLAKKKYDETDNFSLAIGPRGLEIYENSSGFLRPTVSFLWPSFNKFNCDRKKFELACSGSNEAKLSCFARSKEWCMHLRSLCKVTLKHQQTINPRLTELRHQEDCDSTWWMGRYVPSDADDLCREGSSSSSGSQPHTVGNGLPNSKHVDAADNCTIMTSATANSNNETNAGELNGDVCCGVNNGVPGKNVLGGKTEVDLNCESLEIPECAVPDGETSELSGKQCSSKEIALRVQETNRREQNAHAALVSSVFSDDPDTLNRKTSETRGSVEDLNFDDLNINDKEILIDTPPNSDSQNLTTVTPLSSNLSPLDRCLAIRSSTPKNTTASVYRHTSYLGTPLSPYLHNPQQQQQQQQRTHRLHQGSPQHQPLTRHQMGSSGQHSLLWRASCSGRLMKRHLRSLECHPVHSSEHISSLIPLQGYLGHCMYKSTPLSVYNIPIYHQNNVSNIINYPQENDPGSEMLNEALNKDPMEENVGDIVESDNSMEEVEVKVVGRPPPPPYEDAARNSKMRLATGGELGSRGLEYDSDELVVCNNFQSNQQVISSNQGSYSDFNWTRGSPSPKLLAQPQPPSILDFQFPLLTSEDMESDFCTPMVTSPAETQQSQASSLDFQPSDFVVGPRSRYYRSSLNSYEQRVQQHRLDLQAIQVQPQKIKAVSPLYAAQVQLPTPLLGRKNLQVFDERQYSAISQDLRVPLTKTLRKASSTESEPGEVAVKERSRTRPVQRHHSNITYLKDYKNLEDPSLSFPLVNALLKDPSLQQNVRSFPSNLAALVCDGEQQDT